MRIKILSAISILAIAVFINSCENYSVPLPAAGLPASCDTVNVTYSSSSDSMRTIINVQCGTANASCHAPGGASHYDYSTYSGVYSNYRNGLLYAGLFGNSPRMPLTPQPGWNPACMLPKFKAWINSGCPQ